jgi:Zn-dependent protease with chaperone function
MTDKADAARDPQLVTSDEVVTVRVRRSPKYAVFLVLGAALGILVALILTFAFQGTDQKSPNTGLLYSPMQVFGFVALICVSVGIILGGAVALLLDRTVGRRTREVVADRESAHYAD